MCTYIYIYIYMYIINKTHICCIGRVAGKTKTYFAMPRDWRLVETVRRAEGTLEVGVNIDACVSSSPLAESECSQN